MNSAGCGAVGPGGGGACCCGGMPYAAETHAAIGFVTTYRCGNVDAAIAYTQANMLWQQCMQS